MVGVTGGPTLVSDQRLGGPLATRGWLCYPRANRLCLFDPAHLHGVVPGRGLNPAPDSRRLTFMVGFWTSICARNRGRDCPGPGQPFPDTASTRYTWPSEMAWHPDLATPAAQAARCDVPVAPAPLASVWERVVPLPASAADAASGGNSHADAAPHASIPSYEACFQGF